jgi:hypothetical protein
VALAAAVTTLPLVSSPGRAQAQGQGTTPIGTDIGKVPAGAWAEYNITMNDMKGKMRWALVERTPSSISVELTVEGGLTAMIGGQKVVSKMVLEPDPLKHPKPVKRMMIQMADQAPMELPTSDPRVQAQKFTRPDPKNLVNKETIKVPGGTFATSHYKETRGASVVEYWVNETALPLGLVKMSGVPEAGGSGPKVTMELSAKGTDAKAAITKPTKPIDPAMMMGGAPPPPGAHGAGPAPGKASKPSKASDKAGKASDKAGDKPAKE